MNADPFIIITIYVLKFSMIRSNFERQKRRKGMKREKGGIKEGGED